MIRGGILPFDIIAAEYKYFFTLNHAGNLIAPREKNKVIIIAERVIELIKLRTQ
jgi:hypothetical protein